MLALEGWILSPLCLLQLSWLWGWQCQCVKGDRELGGAWAGSGGGVGVNGVPGVGTAVCSEVGCSSRWCKGHKKHGGMHRIYLHEL